MNLAELDKRCFMAKITTRNFSIRCRLYTHIHICLGGTTDYSMRTILGDYVEKWLAVFQELLFFQGRCSNCLLLFLFLWLQRAEI